MILASYTVAVCSLIEAACSYASSNMAENVCAVSGRSILSEYQDNLFSRYGLFFLRNTESILEKKASFYISSSLCMQKGIVRFKSAAADLNMAFYPATSKDELKRQIWKVAIGVNEYILSNFSYSNSFLENTYYRYEVEKIICNEKTDEENLAEMIRKLTAFRFAVNLATLNKEDIDVSAIGTFIEAVIPGHLDDAGVEASQALEQAQRDVSRLFEGLTVPVLPSMESFGTYKDYLRIFLAAIPENEKMRRMMNVMETNIRMIDGIIFSFSDYVYAFDLNAVLIRDPLVDFPIGGRGTKLVSMHFSYK